MWKRPKTVADHHDEPEDPDEMELGEECSTFLAGTYLHFLESRGQPIPPWAWINALAHGDLAEVESAAATPHGLGAPETLIAEVAVALLAALRRGATLDVLQRNTLIPVELALADRAGWAPTDSFELGRIIQAVSATRLRPIPTVHPHR